MNSKKKTEIKIEIARMIRSERNVKERKGDSVVGTTHY